MLFIKHSLQKQLSSHAIPAAQLWFHAYENYSTPRSLSPWHTALRFRHCASHIQTLCSYCQSCSRVCRR